MRITEWTKSEMRDERMKQKRTAVRAAVWAVIWLILPVRALAQESGAVSAYTWEALGSIAGATAATLMIVQFIKAPLDRIWHIPTRLLVYLVALLLMLTAQYFSGGLNVESGVLAAVNAVMAALSAYGSYEVIFVRGGQKHEAEKV